jgi:hypothetical protein
LRPNARLPSSNAAIKRKHGFSIVARAFYLTTFLTSIWYSCSIHTVLLSLQADKSLAHETGCDESLKEGFSNNQEKYHIQISMELD